TQNAIRQLNSYGVQPDILIARANMPLDQKRKEKLSISCSVPAAHIISAPDVDSIYDVPLNFEADGLSDIILRELNITPKQDSDLSEWKDLAARMHNGSKIVKIGIVGKYFDTGDFVLSDAYLSVIEAIKYSAAQLGVKAKIDWLNAKSYQTDPSKVAELKNYDGIIVPGGFGETGIEGKILTAQFCRENKIPYFGLCYGLHMLVIEYARHVLDMKDANTTEIDPATPFPVIDIMLEQKEKLANKNYGGSMRLGAYTTALKDGSIVRDAYGEPEVSERHRHRYEINPEYVEKFEKAGLVFSGTWAEGQLKEIAELPRNVHPFMVGTQYHPELKARPLAPHPLFTAFLQASLDGQK
ncbi:MAG: CTP synthase, partial [Candidatus Pacebacteria bacterium]|nr:CTP synthase [Candidatus Paceibacterota bacterium]